jgi:hypothetical protein
MFIDVDTGPRLNMFVLWSIIYHKFLLFLFKNSCKVMTQTRLKLSSFKVKIINHTDFSNQ